MIFGERGAVRPSLSIARPPARAQRGEARLRWFRGLGRAVPGSGFESQRYLLKWLFVSTAIGIVAGLGVIAFMFAIDWVTQASLGQIVGYLPPSPIGEGQNDLQPIARPWLLPLVTALGALLSGIIVFSLAPEAEGHGTDAAIDAIHHKAGRVRARIPPIKLVASAITIGTGGWGGGVDPADSPHGSGFCQQPALRMSTTVTLLGTRADCGLRNGDCGIHNPKPAFRNSCLSALIWHPGARMTRSGDAAYGCRSQQQCDSDRCGTGRASSPRAAEAVW